MLLLIGWLAGHAWLQGQATLPTPRQSLTGAGVALLLVALALGWWRWRRSRAATRVAWTALVLAAALLGGANAGWRAVQRMDDQLAPHWQGQTLALQGRIAELPQPLAGMGGDSGWRLVLAVEQARSPGLAEPPRLPPRLLLSCFHLPEAPHADERWALTARLRPAHALLNPHGPDGRLWMLEQELGGAGACTAQPAPRRLAPASAWRLQGWRDALRERIQRRLQDRPREASVLVALSLGDQSALAARDWALLRDTGVAHLFSVSGLHITMLAWLAARAGRWAWSRGARLSLAVAAPRAGTALGLATALLYTLFSGWGVPAQRTLWMLVALALLQRLGLRWPWALQLLAVAALVVGLDPWALLQPGFWLSFCAVGLLMAGAPPSPQSGAAPGWRQRLRGALREQLSITLGLAPLTLLLFRQLSLVGLAANALAIPLVSWAVTPLALLGALCPPLWEPAAWLVRGLWVVLEGLQGLPLAVWWVPVAPQWAQLLALAGAALVALALPWRLRLAGLACMLPMLAPLPQRPPPGVLELLALDIGQGNAVLLLTHGHALLYDTGPRWGPDLDAGARVILPVLRALGVPALDLLIVSHADQDHSGGAASVLAGLPVRARLGALRGAPPCERGQAWRWDGVDFELLHPVPEPPAAASATSPRPRANARSCVLRVSAQGRRVLLTADIEAAQEAQLVAREGAQGLRAELLMVPHHGSKTSSSDALLDAVAPRLGLVQSGFQNRFGHPALAVVQRYAARGIVLVNTADCGAWRWRSDGPAAEVLVPAADCERLRRGRYWLADPPRGPGDGDAAGPPLPPLH
ncbi:DNA internalization-related competence protein ComEC/Rec2 [Pelomonas sp. CA6]|uniref:DNA internalization-related competence protein ComEC/Rec2 n=1 Tax=Pelomonas sp. CA6 TaxID=2907999 RepID=UPI001F4BA0D6|nr:DNA internalization-related competence protein ComEC/Rec2 [Pelomonas sp. CA6]MCH7342301.1 DNA internalization-related competence protein ComEC/Rec2 [Pelomonas sp. CA6]